MRSDVCSAVSTLGGFTISVVSRDFFIANTANNTEEINNNNVAIRITLQILQPVFGAKSAESFSNSLISLELFILPIIYAFL